MTKNIFIAIKKTKSGVNGLTKIPMTKLFFSELNIKDEYIVPEEIASKINVLFCESPPKNIGDMESLEYLQISSTGYSQLFGLGLAEKGIQVCNARGVFDTPIAEWAIAMMVNLNRDLRTMIRNQEACIWERPSKFQAELRGKTLGLFGYGSIGREVARVAKYLGLKIHAYDKERADFTSRNYYMLPGTGDPKCKLPDKFFYPNEEKEFMSGLDFLAVAMPLNNATEGIVTEEYLRALPKGAYVLNFARGPLIRENALLKVLLDGHLGGAALDTHYYYPMPADHPLWKITNVIMTPHISGSSLSTNFLDRIYDIFTINVKNFINEKPLLNKLTQSQLSGN